ncbi:hypothetical protein RB195_003904 [Necator americanus]|uniref:ShKT domain-containing protein n=1 Tax=Necator americanus TaxID=51031 RepID=A0ABR1DQR5_NECAM
MVPYGFYILLILTVAVEYGQVSARDDPFCKDYLDSFACRSWLNTICKNPMLKMHAKAHCKKTCGFCNDPWW